MRYGEYLVTGKRQYRGHDPGTTFEARLEPNAERRAIARGDIRLIREIHPTVPPGHTFPAGWLAGQTPNTEAPARASLS